METDPPNYRLWKMNESDTQANVKILSSIYFLFDSQTTVVISNSNFKYIFMTFKSRSTFNMRYYTRIHTIVHSSET